MTTATLPTSIPTTQPTTVRARMLSLLADEGPLAAPAIAARLGIGEAQAVARTRAYTRAGFLHRDEFGEYAPWCPWPRVGF